MKHIGDHDENNEEMEEIMKKIWTLLLVIGIILSAAITHADPGVKESFYRNCIDLRIKNCDLKAELLNSKYQHIRQWARRSSEEAKFYRDRKEQLIQALVQQNVEEKPYKVDYFLIQAYTGAGSSLTASQAGTKQ